MPPGQQVVDAPHLRIQPVVSRIANGHNGEARAQQFADVAGHLKRLAVGGDGLAVAHAHFTKGMHQAFIYIGGRNDHGSKEITFSAFVNAHVRLNRLGIQQILIAQLDVLENLRFQPERHPLLRAPALHQAFAALVEGDVAIGPLCRDQGVFHRHGPVIPGPQQLDQSLLLGFIQLEGVRIFFHHAVHPNKNPGG